MARGAKSRGTRIAFGDGRHIIWAQHAHEIYTNNPNVARPGDERASDLEWIRFHPGHRVYNRIDSNKRHWVWNNKFRAQPGEIFLSSNEQRFAEAVNPGFILIEPNVPMHKLCAVNKTWALQNYQAVVDALVERGHRVVQLEYFGMRWRLDRVQLVATPTIRSALAVLSRAVLYVGPEGGMHHAAAAFDLPAVVLFGGFASPHVLGYQWHINLTGGVEACGSLRQCEHCANAMKAIRPEVVIEEAMQQLCVPSTISA